MRPPRAAYEWPIVQCKCNHWGPCCCRSVRPATTELVRLPLARVSHAFRAGERGPTPLHPGGPPLGGPTSSASSTRRLQVCRIATPSPIPSPSSHPSLSHPAPRSMRERGSRDSPAFRRHVRPVRLHLLRHLRRFMILASLFVVVRRLPCRLPCAFRLPCCLVFACASGVARDRDPSCASSAPQRYPFSRV